jgi:predicted transcriptional regulator
MQLSFMCRMVTVEQLLKCSLGLSRSEIRLLKALPLKELDARSIATLMRKDRTSVQRALSKLHRKGLVHRRQVNKGEGGYFFLYKPVPKQVMKERIYANFKGFTKAVEDAIERW